MTAYITHLECSATGETYPAGQVHNLSRAGKPLLVRYDLQRLAGAVDKATLQKRTGGFWRYAEFLPVSDARNRISLGECVTPIIDCERTARRHGVTEAGKLLVKDESRLPTASFKARGLGVAVSMARELGLERLAMPTNGNAGAALAAYCTRAGLKSLVFCPDDTPDVNVREIALLGAATYRVNGLINDCGKIVGQCARDGGWFDTSTLKEPYRIEGKKTMGLELAEQLNWTLPDVIFYPTGGGTGLIGMWKVFDELEAIGWIGPQRPRMVAVQASGCAPIVKAFNDGLEEAPLWQGASTIAWGIRVPVAVGDFLILRAVRASGGFATAVDDDDILDAQAAMAANEGVHLSPEGAATFAAWRHAVKNGDVAPHERAVLFNCGNGLKYDMPPVTGTVDCTAPIDTSQFD